MGLTTTVGSDDHEATLAGEERRDQDRRVQGDLEGGRPLLACSCDTLQLTGATRLQEKSPESRNILGRC